MSEPSPEATALFRHAKVDDWGLAILAWERGPRRGYQFEDGELRIFREGYYHFMKEVDVPQDKTARVVPKLSRMLGDDAERITVAAKAARPEIDFDDQLRIFSIRFPDGFGEGAWAKKIRGAGAKRTLKRHRDGATENACAALGEDALSRLMEAGDHAGIIASAVAVLRATDLVTAKQLKRLEQIPAGRVRPAAVALYELLHGDESFAVRQERFIASIASAKSAAPSWQLATALPALLHPDEHICVRPATVKRQAAWAAPRLAINRTPNAPVYSRLLEMCVAIQDRLSEAGLEPRDLFDVYDFMVETLKPSAKKLLEH